MNCTRRDGLWRAAEGYCTPKRGRETSGKSHTTCRRRPVRDRPGHTNDRAAIFFGEVANGAGGRPCPAPSRPGAWRRCPCRPWQGPPRCADGNHHTPEGCPGDHPPATPGKAQGLTWRYGARAARRGGLAAARCRMCLGTYRPLQPVVMRHSPHL